MGKEKLIPILALIVLLIGSSSTVYVYATQDNTNINTDAITIYNKQYTIEEIFSIAEPRTFNDLNYSGVALDDLIAKTGVDCPECYTYTITGEGEYQKTVTWENMQNGLITLDKRVVFTDLPKAFRVRGVVEIEVK